MDEETLRELREWLHYQARDHERDNWPASVAYSRVLAWIDQH